jgi:hypothetical protein
LDSFQNLIPHLPILTQAIFTLSRMSAIASQLIFQLTSFLFPQCDQDDADKPWDRSSAH